jgi:hypothetical protein
VVTETESWSFGSSSRRRRAIEVLPAPEGEDSTSITPRRRIAGARGALEAVIGSPIAEMLPPGRSADRRAIAARGILAPGKVADQLA